MEYPHVSIIILNWKNYKDTIKCLESVYQIEYYDYDVVLVNNGSKESLENIEHYFHGNNIVKSEFFSYSNRSIPIKILDQTFKIKKNNRYYNSYLKQLILIQNDKNYGFAEGNNIGAEYALKNLKTDYILLLNNDTTVDINFLKELVKVAEGDKNIGSVQSLLLKDDKTSIDSLGQKMVSWGAKEIIDKSEKYLQSQVDIFGACAASALYRSDLIKEFGLFDRDFFVLLEDVDLSWRIRLMGMKSMLASNSIVYHKRGISQPRSLNNILNILIRGKTPETLLKWYYGSRNWLIIFIRYYPLKMIFISAVKCPKELFFTFSLFLYTSIKLKNIHRTWQLLLRNIEIRKKIKNNELLSDIQKKWIEST